MEKIIQITSGRGPLECMYVVTKVLKEMVKETESFQLEYQVIRREVGPKPETLSSVIISLKGKRLQEFMNRWEGSILWIGKSPYRKFHKRKNWFVEVNGYQSIAGSQFDVSDIEFKTTKSSGPGGQHVNKTDSAVWATHKKSGVKVFVQDTRSQFQNKKIAISRLEQAIKKNETDQLQKQNFEQWKNTTDIQRGNPIRTYIGTEFKLKK